MTSYKNIVLAISALCLFRSTHIVASETTPAPAAISAAQVELMQKRIQALEQQLRESRIAESRAKLEVIEAHSKIGKNEAEKRHLELRVLIRDIGYGALLSDGSAETCSELFELYKTRRDQIFSSSK